MRITRDLKEKTADDYDDNDDSKCVFFLFYYYIIIERISPFRQTGNKKCAYLYDAMLCADSRVEESRLFVSQFTFMTNK